MSDLDPFSLLLEGRDPCGSVLEGDLSARKAPKRVPAMALRILGRRSHRFAGKPAVAKDEGSMTLDVV